MLGVYRSLAKAYTIQSVTHDVQQNLRVGMEEMSREIILAGLEAAHDVKALIDYPDETAGGLMTTDYIEVGPDTKVWQAIDRVRATVRDEGVETISSVLPGSYTVSESTPDLCVLTASKIIDFSSRTFPGK